MSLLCEHSWASEKRIYMVDVSNCSVCVCLKTELTVGLREAFAYRISPSTTTVSVAHITRGFKSLIVVDSKRYKTTSYRCNNLSWQ